MAGHRAEQVERVADTAGSVEEDVVYYIAAGVAFVVEETVDVGAAAVEGVVSEADVAVAVAAEAGVVEADVSEVDVAEIGANLVYVAVLKIVSGRNILSMRIYNISLPLCHILSGSQSQSS